MVVVVVVVVVVGFVFVVVALVSPVKMKLISNIFSKWKLLSNYYIPV